MLNRNLLKTAATSLIALTMLGSATAQALWVQYKPETEIITQFHGNPHKAELTLFMAGNQFVVMDNLIAEFKKQYPKYDNIHYVTIPPGQELNWILNGGAEWRAADFPDVQELDKNGSDNPDDWEMNTTAEPGVGFQMTKLPDVYTTVARGHMTQLANAGLAKTAFTYTHNQLALMAHTDQVDAILAIANAQSLFPGQPGQTGDGELTAEGLYRVLASDMVWLSEPDIQTQGIERHIWRMYTNASYAVFDCETTPAQPVCGVLVNDVRPNVPDTCTDMGAWFASKGEPDESLRKIVYQLKRCDEGDYTSEEDATTFITAVHHLETPANIFDGLPSRLTVGPVWGTEVEFQQFRKDEPDIVAIRIDDAAGPDGKALNRSDDVNYLATKVESAKYPGAAKDFLNFLKSVEAQFILEQAGFIPATEEELNTDIPLP
ncbi:MAG: substrate-binding domain-containing protein [Gammaproteobacteria bacterium]|nr:MAG: substrate-binding domain-containing protein [Gammaproteobacteria bacterium]